jgi:antitoxin component YwqK of YwqJK toxin-antitoxin module
MIMRKLAFTTVLFSAIIVLAQNPIFVNGKFYDKSNLYTGIVKSYDASQKLVSTVEVTKGEMNGEMIFYFPSGEVMEKGLYAYGEKHGTWTRYNENKVITATANYKNGKKDGEWKMFSEEGKLKMVMHYDSGEKTGTWAMYDETGKISSEKNYGSFN